MNTFGVILCLLCSMAAGYGVSYAVDEHFYLREWLAEKPWSVKIKPWMIVAVTIALIVGLGLLMNLFKAPQIVYFITSGVLLGVMLRVLPSNKRE